MRRCYAHLCIYVRTRVHRYYMFMLAARAERRTVRVYTCTHMYVRAYVRTQLAFSRRQPPWLLSKPALLLDGIKMSSRSSHSRTAQDSRCGGYRCPTVFKHHHKGRQDPIPQTSRSGIDKVKAKGRDYRQELAQFTQEIDNATGYGCNDVSEKERILHKRTLDDQRWEEASRLREIQDAKADFQCKVAAGELTVDDEWAPYYWGRQLSWPTCLSDKSPPRPRTSRSSSTTASSCFSRTSRRGWL